MGRTACTEPQCLYKGALYLYLYNLMGPPSYMRCVVNREVVMRRIPVILQEKVAFEHSFKPFSQMMFNPLNPELNPICHLLALLAHHFLHVSRIRVKSLTLRLLMSYIYGAPILDVSRSHTTTHHSR